MKKFDAVEMMRDIRDKLTKRYLEAPELEAKELEEVRRKYGLAERRIFTRTSERKP